jgi:hypothetical protein
MKWIACRYLWAFAAALLGLPKSGWSGACLGDSLKYRYFQEEVGQFNGTSRVTVQLPCDTMIVETGKMTTIYPNTLLHFGKRVSENCAILVRGQLYAKAGRTSKIIFAGDVDSSEFGIVSGTGIWGGLLIDTVGSVYFDNVEVKNASTAMIFIGRNSRMEKVGFIGSFGLILPGGHNFSLNPKGTYFTAFDILDPPKKASLEKPPAIVVAPTGPEKPRRTAKETAVATSGTPPWIWGSVAAGALVAGGAAAYVFWPASESADPDPAEPGKPDAFEDLPTKPSVLNR